MTKAEELSALNAFVASLPHGTYLRPWLAKVQAEVEWLVRGDIFPDIDLAGAAKDASKIRAEAAEQAAGIRQKAEQEAERIIASARSEAARIVANAEATAEATTSTFAREVRDLRRALSAIQA